MSQLNKIKKHLLLGHSITPIEALNMFGVFRLSARINDLRNTGMIIKTIIIEKNNKRFAKYLIEDDRFKKL